MPSDRTILLALIHSLTLADHLGDVQEDIEAALKVMDSEFYKDYEAEDMDDLRERLEDLYDIPEGGIHSL